MNASELRRLDLNLLPVFLALMRERHVTRAGASLFLSQPATSSALGRLRAIFNDPLFVRNGRLLEPTPRAEAIAEELNSALQAVSNAVFGSAPFNPATDEHIFHLGCSAETALAALPAFREVRREAPNCKLVVHSANFRSVAALLDSGEIGTAIGFMSDELPATARMRVLRRGGFRILRDKDSPGPVDLDMFCARPHIIVTLRGDLRGFVDDILEKLGRQRTVYAGVPDFALLPQILPGSQLLCTVSELVIDALTAINANLAADPPPFETPRSVMKMAWRGILDQYPAERWFRAKLAAHLEKIPVAEPPPKIPS